jgi:hypothetical protein
LSEHSTAIVARWSAGSFLNPSQKFRAILKFLEAIVSVIAWMLRRGSLNLDIEGLKVKRQHFSLFLAEIDLSASISVIVPK